MSRQNAARKQNLFELMEEFQKEKPDQEKIRFLFKEFNLSYTADPVEQMMTVLSSCDEVKNKKASELEPT